jgi:tRNA(fMet)-specific endonuclease VapC
MKYMLDTNILIYFLNKKSSRIAQRIDNLPPEAHLCMSFITYAELLKGAERSTKKTAVLRQLDQLTRIIAVDLIADRSICQHYAEQFPRLKEAGTPIGANDLWIACHALAQGCVLVTNNERKFERVAGLAIENWI